MEETKDKESTNKPIVDNFAQLEIQFLYRTGKKIGLATFGIGVLYLISYIWNYAYYRTLGIPPFFFEFKLPGILIPKSLLLVSFLLFLFIPLFLNKFYDYLLQTTGPDFLDEHTADLFRGSKYFFVIKKALLLFKYPLFYFFIAQIFFLLIGYYWNILTTFVGILLGELLLKLSYSKNRVRFWYFIFFCLWVILFVQYFDGTITAKRDLRNCNFPIISFTGEGEEKEVCLLLAVFNNKYFLLSTDDTKIATVKYKIIDMSKIDHLEYRNFYHVESASKETKKKLKELRKQRVQLLKKAKKIADDTNDPNFYIEAENKLKALLGN